MSTNLKSVKMLQMRPGLIYTLVFIKNNTDILLGFKKRGLGVNKWNGFGGKVESGESLCDGAIRETKEESNLDIFNPEHIGVLTYEEQQCQQIDIVHVFTVKHYENILQETEEMLPKWFKISEIPFQDMWPDFKVWNYYMLKDKYFHAHTVYKNENTYKNCLVEEFSCVEDAVKNVERVIQLKTQ